MSGTLPILLKILRKILIFFRFNGNRKCEENMVNHLFHYACIGKDGSRATKADGNKNYTLRMQKIVKMYTSTFPPSSGLEPATAELIIVAELPSLTRELTSVARSVRFVATT